MRMQLLDMLLVISANKTNVNVGVGPRQQTDKIN